MKNENLFWSEMSKSDWDGRCEINAISGCGNSVLMHSLFYLPKYALELSQMEEINIHQVNEEGESAFLMAAQEDRFDVAQNLIEKGCDINHRDIYRRTALLHAVTNKMLSDSKGELMDLIIEKSITSAPGEKHFKDTLSILRDDLTGKASFNFDKDEVFQMVAELEKNRLSFQLKNNTAPEVPKIRL